jgi:methionyl-tRNA formyltransferase
MNKIRVGYFADGPWSHLAFEKIIKDKSIEVIFIVPRSDTNDETLKEYCLKHKIDYLYPVLINTPEFIETAKSYNVDLFVSMSFNQIFKSAILAVPKFGVINCHAGKLPFYRGRNILNWALINDEKDFGITVHFVDEGIDTGDIIKQNIYPIIDLDDYNSILKVAYVECAIILYDTIKEIQNGSFRRIVQNTIHPIGFYCGIRGKGDEIINWNQTSRQLFNFIRAINKPGPIATSSLKGKCVKINKANLIQNAPNYIGIPGQLLSKTKNGFIIKSSDNFLEISEIESDIKLKIGDKLG